MLAIGIGLGVTFGGSGGPRGPSLRLSPREIAENAANGTTVGTASVSNGSGTYAFTETSDPDSKFAVNSSTGVVTKTAALSYNTAASHSYAIEADNSVDDPALTTRTFTINVLAVLGNLTFVDFPETLTIGVPADGDITGAHDDGVITIPGAPAGLTVDSEARTWAWSGVGDVDDGTFVPTETHPQATNSPYATSGVTWEIAEAPEVSIIIALGLGQSNMMGSLAYDGLDSDIEGIFHYPLKSGDPDYHTVSSDLTPWKNPDPYVVDDFQVTPFHNFVARLKTENPEAIVFGALQAVGATGLNAGTGNPYWTPSMTPGDGGLYFEQTLTNIPAMVTAIRALYPGAPVVIERAWCQGENDALISVSRSTYATDLTNLIDYMEARIDIEGVSWGKFTILSMVPHLWYDPEYGDYNVDYETVNAAQVDVSLAHADVIYTTGSFDSTASLHYEPEAEVRVNGTRLGNARYDVAAGPSVTNSATASTVNNLPLAIALTHNDATLHATFEIHGGADAAEFELSDPFLRPTLRWAGNDNGPTAGDYVVNVRARDGSGNYGSDRTITVTQEEATAEWALIADDMAHYTGASTGCTTPEMDTDGADFAIAVVARVSFFGAGTLSDSESNTWVAATQYGGGAPATRVYYCINPTTAADHTVSWAGNDQYATLHVSFWSGAKQTSPLDQETATEYATVGPWESGSITTTVNGALCVAALGMAGGFGYTYTGSPAFTIINNYVRDSGTHYSLCVAYYVQNTAGAVNSEWSQNTGLGGNGSSTASLTAFKPA